MNEQIEPLSVKEYAIIGKALWELVQQYPSQENDPDVYAEYDALDSGKSLAVFALPGGRYKNYYISGGYTAEISFRVAYKSNPKSSDNRINAQAFVGRVMEWLESTDNLPALTDSRKITKITVLNAIPFMLESEEGDGTIYAADAVMEYRKKGATK